MDCKQPGEGLKLQNRRVPCQRKSLDRCGPVGWIPQGVKGHWGNKLL